MTDEHKQSGYALFYKMKVKQLDNVDFSQASKIISEEWNRLDEHQRQFYVKEVGVERKKMLKKKASEQAHMVAQQALK